MLFDDDLYSNPPKKIYETNKTVYNHIDEKFSIDLAEMIENKISNNKEFRFIFAIIDFLSKFLWVIPLKKKNSQTITQEVSNNLTTSKRSPLKLENDRGKEWYNIIFQSFPKNKKIHQCSRFTDKGPSIAERVIRKARTSLKKPVFEKGNADWLSELPFITK